MAVPDPTCALRRLLATMVLSLAFAAPQGMAQEGMRIGYVDMKRLLDNAPQVQEGRARLAEEFDARGARLEQEEERLAASRRELARARDTLPTDELLRREDELESLARAIERTRVQLREELRQRSEEETERAWNDVNAAVIEYARESGFDLVLPSPVIYASTRVDLTDAVLARLRSQQALAGDGRP